MSIINNGMKLSINQTIFFLVKLNPRKMIEKV